MKGSLTNENINHLVCSNLIIGFLHFQLPFQLHGVYCFVVILVTEFVNREFVNNEDQLCPQAHTHHTTHYNFKCELLAFNSGSTWSSTNSVLVV